MKTVASVSFRDDHSVTMDVEKVVGIEVGRPMDLGDGNWFCELIVRTAEGFIAMQMVGDSPERFSICPDQSMGGDDF